MLRPAEPVLWVIGAGGLIGRRVTARARAEGHRVLVSAIPWDDPVRRDAALAAGVRDLGIEAGTGPWGVLWCAGAGVVATAEAALREEVACFAALGKALAAARPPGDGAFVVASSAGGVYAGASDPPFTEATPARAVVGYGRAKLDIEQLATSTIGAVGVPVTLARLSTVYGPGQRLDKPQGVVAQLCLAAAQGWPLRLTVSLDTIRDYLYVEDAARLLLGCLHRTLSEQVGVTKILASGQAVSLAQVLAEARRVLHRPMRTQVVPGAGAGQVPVLAYRSQVWTDLDRTTATTLATGIAATAADIARRVALADLAAS